MDIPSSVASCLYSGISNKIDFLKKFHPDFEDKYVRHNYRDITESLKWYKENCLLSYDQLKKKYDNLTNIIQHRLDEWKTCFINV